MAEFLAIQTHTEKYDKGDVYWVAANSHSYGTADLNNRVIVKSPSIALSDARAYMGQLLHRFLIDTLSSDLVTDTHWLKLYSEFSLNPGSVNVQKIVDHLTLWGATNFATVGQSLEFDLSVFDAAVSEGLWGVNVGALAPAEIYDQPSGIHTITADYSSTGKNSTPVELKVDEKGFTITNHLNKVITYEVHRSQIAPLLKAEVERYGKGVQAYKRWKFNAPVVDAAVANGGEVTLTPAQVQNNLIDKTAL